MFQFVPRMIPNRIFVVGCGGTGSRLIPLLAQFVRTITHGVTPRGHVVDPVIYLIDADVVEEKNLLRQNFIQADVGKPKAAVLANRYSRAYGVNIVPVVSMVKPSSRPVPGAILGSEEVGNNSMVIMCVDSAQARRDIIQSFSEFSVYPGHSRSGVTTSPHLGTFFIDAGNEDDFGQVRFFNSVMLSGKSSVRTHPNKTAFSPAKVDIPFIPMDEEFYASLVDTPSASCADLDQTLAINAMMATMIMGVVQNYYYVKPFSYHSMSISLNGSVSSRSITPEYLWDISIYHRPNSGFAKRLPLSYVTPVIEDYWDRQVKELSRMGLDGQGNLLPTQAVVEEPTEEGGQRLDTTTDVQEAAEEDDLPEESPEPAVAAAPQAIPALIPGLAGV